jgi:LacI family transcriptional regulator
MRFLRQLNIRVPDDIAVMLYDNIPELDSIEYPLTTVSPPLDELVGRALSILLEPGNREQKKWRNEVITPEIVVRDYRYRTEHM